MRVSLMYNEDAGDGLSNDDLVDEIRRSGHDVVHLVDNPTAFARTLDDSIDLAVTAGGDGTVRSAAVSLAGRPIPLAILPFGTANNIAFSGEVARSSKRLGRDSWLRGSLRPNSTSITSTTLTRGFEGRSRPFETCWSTSRRSP